MAPTTFSSPDLKGRLFSSGSISEPVSEVLARRKGDRWDKECGILRDSADLLAFKLGIQMGSASGHNLGVFYPQNAVVIEVQSSILILCVRDVGKIACDSNWLEAPTLHKNLCSRYSHNAWQSKLGDAFVKYGLVPKPQPPAPPKPAEATPTPRAAAAPVDATKAEPAREVASFAPTEDKEDFAAYMARQKALFGGEEPKKEEAPSSAGEPHANKYFTPDSEIHLGEPGQAKPQENRFANLYKTSEEPDPEPEPEPEPEEPKRKLTHVDELELSLREVSAVEAREANTVVAEVVTATVLDLVDMVELMQDCEDDLLWHEYETNCDDELAEDHRKFSATLNHLFKAEKVQVPMTDVHLEDHLDADKLMLADLTAEENTPFTQPIRQLVERFGQTVLMIEEVEETIASLEELEHAIKVVDKIAPVRKPVEKLHHHNTSTGPRAVEAPKDLPPPGSVKPSKAKRVSRKPALPKLSMPTESFPERDYPHADLSKAVVPVPELCVSLSEVMKPKGEARDGGAAEEGIMLRLYEYIHDKASTLKQVFMEFDTDGSGKIDEQELYYALRKMEYSVDFGECRTIIRSIETHAASLEKELHANHKGYRAAGKMAAEELLMGIQHQNQGGYERNVDGKIDYKELMLTLNHIAKQKGVTTRMSRFTPGGQLKKRTPGASILKASAGASKLKGVRGIQGLNSLYRTHARISHSDAGMTEEDVASADDLGPINPVKQLAEDEYGLKSADGFLFPIHNSKVMDCKALLAEPSRVVEVDTHSVQVQTIAELITCLAFDKSQLHKPTLRKMQGDMLTLLVAACHVENLRLFIATVEKVLDSDGQESDVDSVIELVASSFAMDTTVLDWHQKEESLRGVDRAMDILWYSRCREEFEAEDDVAACKGMWKQIYCELRFQRHLRGGLDKITEAELQMWENFIGGLVQTVDLSETGCRDEAVAVAVTYCPNIKYLDLHDTKVTDEAIGELVGTLQDLIWINIEDTAITGDGVEKLIKTYPKLELVG